MRNPYATNMPMSKAGTYDPSVKDDELGAGFASQMAGTMATDLIEGMLGGSLDEDGVKGGALFSLPDDRFFSPSYITQVGLRGNELRQMVVGRTNPQHIYLHFPAQNNRVFEVVSPEGQPILKTSKEGILVMRSLIYLVIEI